MGNTPPPSEKKARIMVADDHPLVRSGLAQVLNQQSDMVCTAGASDQAEVLKAIEEHRPELLVLDLRLKSGDGLEFIKALKARFPELPVLVLSQFDESLYAERALRAGARGYVMKEQASEEVLDAIRTVLAGGIYVTAAMNSRLLRKMIADKPLSGDESVERLSDRELHVLQLLGAGMSTRQIAEHMHLSVKTVETYRENLKHKLTLRNAEELVYFARQWVDKHVGAPGVSGRRED